MMAAKKQQKSQKTKANASSPKAADPELAQRLFAQVDKEDLQNLTKEHMDAIAQTHTKLAVRKRGEAKIAFSDNGNENRNWDERKTYIDIVCEDMAFLVDSVGALLGERHMLIDLLLHPLLSVSYDANGRSHIDPRGHGHQSHIHVVIRGILNAGQQDALRQDFLSVIDDVTYGTRDWQAMRLRAIETKQYISGAPEDRFDPEELSEYAEFLDYIYDNNFTFLGARDYKFVRKDGKLTSQIVKGSGLGLLSDERFPAYISEDGEPLAASLQELRTKMPALSISKVNRIATVHRRVPLDAVTVQHFDEDGNVVGETLFIGLFTSVTYSRSLRSIPLLKYKSDRVIRESGFEPASHDGRALRHILEKYPRDELFQITVKELKATCLSILKLQERQRIALYCRPDLFGRYVSCLVYVPRDRYETRLRLKFQSILEKELDGVCTNFYSSVDDSPLVRILFTIAVSQKRKRSINAAPIEEKLQQAGRIWGDALADALHQTFSDDETAATLAQQYADAFSNDYRERYALESAVRDIEKVNECLETGNLTLDLQQNGSGYTLKVYTLGGALVLSDILPLLENMGVRILSEHPFDVRPLSAAQQVVIQDFSIDAPGAADFAALKPLFEEAFMGLFAGVYENDTLNALTLRSGVSARDVMLVRTYVRYLRQSNLPFSLPYMEQALITHPALARLFINLIYTQFDPAIKNHKTAVIHGAIASGLDAVTSLDHDRILRAVYTAIKASLRTNFFQKGKDGNPKPYISVKLNSRAIDFIPNPKPYREIFVYSARMEGVHLRNNRIARGGIRWSDRTEDFRTEILGLMKAQTVKNAVIVPSGAKGGFIVKRPPASGNRAEIQSEGVECYRYLVRGLLDITDNYGKGGKIVPPSSVVRLDENDPYLVVAADKGTATFSDYANALSVEYGFWMGDAFASGGSAGYDHKVMGITARGAWESVKRHFREIGHDTQKTPFDVIGVGDMGGDVFGNGMLLSPHIRLVGVFNHVHIFCDPEPDVKSSFAERQRLFKNVLGWDHYNEKLLSKGGRIYSRKDKVLDLTPEIQKRFDLSKAKVTPSELMQAMLKARTDLIYLGGIGTYVKASSESHADAGDRSNDANRVDARDLRAAVVGEGANLGFTQRARIEYASGGGHLNADFIDNSAGVDTSDHEVNIKILLSLVMAGNKARLTRPARDKLLKTMTDDIAALVLADNYQQTQAISLIEIQAAEALTAHQKFIQDLERDGALDRSLEFLPDDETIARRKAANKGLTRPEIAILLSYAKIKLREELLASDIPDKADLNEWLTGYFPQALQQKYHADILKHPLRREIIATLVSNTLVNRLGPTYVQAAISDLGVSAAAIARAFIATCKILDLENVWHEIESLDAKVPAQVQLRAFRENAILTTRMMAWFLRQDGNDVQIERIIKTWAGPAKEYYGLLGSEKSVKSILTPAQLASWSDRQRAWHKDGFPAEMAHMLALRTKFSQAPYILGLARDLKKPIAAVAKIYLPMGDVFAFTWLRTQIDALPKADRWAVMAADSMQDKIDQMQRRLAAAVMQTGGRTAPSLDAWLKKNQGRTAEIFHLLADLKRTGLTDLSILIVLLQKMEQLA